APSRPNQSAQEKGATASFTLPRTGSSNPVPSSRQSVSRRNSAPLVIKPRFSASVGTRPGGTVGRDAQGQATSCWGTVASLSGDILVPGVADAVLDGGAPPPSAVGPLGIQRYR